MSKYKKKLSSQAHKEHNLLQRFGINLAQYESMLISQNGRCAVCRNSETMKRYGNAQSLSIDHCHTTHRVRGLLCHRCNHTLGLCQDNADLLRKLATYVESADPGFPRLKRKTGDELLGELEGL